MQITSTNFPQFGSAESMFNPCDNTPMNAAKIITDCYQLPANITARPELLLPGEL
jgi:hypothetical protein